MESDKVQHFTAGAGITASALTLGLDPWASLAISVAAGAAKEGWDALGHGTPDHRDFLWTAAGGLLLFGIRMWIGW